MQVRDSRFKKTIICFPGTKVQILTQKALLDAPNDSNVHFYLKELMKENVGHVVRVCDPTYDTTCLQQSNITVHVRASLSLFLSLPLSLSLSLSVSII